MLINQGCASSDELHRYLAGDMTAAHQNVIAAHLEECSSCQERLTSAAGGVVLWQEAASMLEDYHSDTSDLIAAENASCRSNKKLSGIDSHLAHWMGPTDDPTKLGRIGHYEVIGIIGYGGAGVVLRAHDSRLNRPVAIKALLPALAHNPMARRRFERESRAVAAIVHQNVVPIYTVDIYNDHPYIAMQFVAGRSLQQRIDKEGALAVSQIVRIAIQIAQALAAAHAQGIIHRDIKPANILLESTVDRAYVTDFGLARVVDDATTHSGMVTGTPQYMSPEQCHGNSVDHRTDLFSLGSVMYAMCTGQPPFRSQTLMGMLRKVCDCQPRNILELNPDIPAWLQALVFRLLSKNAADRFASATQLAEILQGELAHLQNPNSIPVPNRDWMPRQHVAAPAAITSSSRSFSGNFSKGASMVLLTFLLGGLSAFLLLQDDSDATAQSRKPSKGASAEATVGDWKLQEMDDKRPYYESKKKESVAAKQGGQLTLRLESGHATVKSADQNEVTVELVQQVAAATAEEAQKISESLKLKLDSKDGNVEVISEREGQQDIKEGEPHFTSIEYIVTVPTSYSIDAETKGGHVLAEKINGKCELKTAGGHVECNKIEGDVILNTAGGHLTANKVTGSVEAKTAGGHIELSKIDGVVDAQTHGGHITGQKLGGNVHAQSNGGNIALDAVEGNLVLDASSGEVELKHVLGEIQATSQSGNMSIEYPAEIKANSKISLGSGNIAISLPKEAAATLHAIVSNGSFEVSSEFKEKSEKESKPQTAIISSSSGLSTSEQSSSSTQIISREFNGGGPSIDVRVGSGQLSIEVAP